MKNTIIRDLGEMFCPHTCISCGKVGGVICECCKSYIIGRAWNRCLNCGGFSRGNICENCDLPFRRQFCVGSREGALKELINDYKFRSVRAAYFDLAEMLFTRTGSLVGYNIVPLPTIMKHVRQRGFDHIDKLAKELARLSGGRLCRALERNVNSTQVGADKRKRIVQAQSAFKISSKMEPGVDYLLLDDIWTTGSSIKSAARLLQANGARTVDVALLAKSN